MDRICYDLLSQLSLENVELINLQDFERTDERLLQARSSRSRLEYYFTCSPFLPTFIFDKNPDVDLITYLDADVFFFTDPGPVFDEMGDHSIAIIEHRFSPHLRHLERYGVYNVGWVSFRRDEHAAACLKRWREECLAWCCDHTEGGRFADQKYLDDWPRLFANVIVLRHKGANVAPWNLLNYTISLSDGRVWVDDQPLIFFHFHGLKKINSWLYDPQTAQYDVPISTLVRRRVYQPYIRALSDVDRRVVVPGFENGLRRGKQAQVQGAAAPDSDGGLGNTLRMAYRILNRTYIPYVAGRAW